MASIVPKDGSSDVAVYEFKEDNSVNDSRKSVKWRKLTQFTWGIIIPLLFIALILLSSLLLIARAKLKKQNTPTEESQYCYPNVCKRKFDIPPLLIVSSDGFRSSYLEQNITPTIQRLINCGTHSKYVLPTFPSKTFPNHYTIATGLYPAWHGIVDNRFYDVEKKDYFKKSTNQSGWYFGEPIWETAQKFGLKSAVFYWPGSEGLGKLPNYWRKYDSTVPFTHRVDTIIEWLNLPDNERPTIIKVYFEEPDYAGHDGGPDSQKVRTAMILMDGIINYLISRLLDEGLMGCINLVLLSDHGMQEISETKSVITENYFGSQFDDLFFSGVVARIEINQTSHKDVDNTINSMISKLECQHGSNYLVYRKDLVPIRFHYAGSSRIGDIIIKGRPGACIFLTDEERKMYKLLGDHGYDNRLVTMRAIFVAIGPDIAQNQEISSFQNIEFYNLFAHLLRIDAAPNNGTNGTLFGALRNPPPIPNTVANHSSDQCTNEINIKPCSSSKDCQVMDGMHRNCTKILSTSVSASHAFTGELCNIQLCDAIIHFDKKLQKTVMVESILKKAMWLEEIKQDCMMSITNVTQINSCDIARTDSYSQISLFGNLDRYYTLDLARVNVSKDFADGVWQYVLNETLKYMTKYGDLRLFSGAVYDQNGDGVRDSDDLIRISDPSHIYFAFMWCKNRALIGHTLCKDTVFVPYILPIKGRNLNCLNSTEYLFDNTVRMRDIELLTGMEFFTDRRVWSAVEAIELRTLLPESI